jgi:putative membrane protein
VVSPLLLALIPFLIFFTPWYQTSLQHPLLQPLTQVVLLLVGLAVLVPLWEADTIAARNPYLVALLFAFIELLADAVPGIVIRLDTHVIAVSTHWPGPGVRPRWPTSSLAGTSGGAPWRP